ncbi:hypothetical protein GGX14DRAFT_571902 [Mycena pura]|uniref:Uncharacterized protein n=1 Tax=Mycena pura TaxID=153505 RepID=A0AAD6V270_9AGAR|nr:hypothetical protein GGX14DRAFT_571902 [Mycena pura]
MFPSFTTPVCICGNATMQTACLKFICHITTWFSTREPIAKWSNARGDIPYSLYSTWSSSYSLKFMQGQWTSGHGRLCISQQPQRSTRSETSSTRSVQLPLWRAHTAYPHSPSPRLLTHDYRPAGQQGGPTRAARQGGDAPARDAREHARCVQSVMDMLRAAGRSARPWGWAVERITDFFFRKPVDALPVDERLHVLVTTYEGQPVFFLCFRLTLTYRTKREKARPEEPLLPPRRCFRSSCALSPPSPYEHAAYPESAQDACSLPSCRAASCTRCRTADAQYGPLQLEAALVEGRSRPPSILPLMHSAPRCMLTRLQASSASTWCAARRSCSAASRRSQLIARHIAVHTGQSGR